MKTIVTPEIEQLPEPSFLRVRIHSLRFQIEWMAAASYARATGKEHRQYSIHAKLMTLTHENGTTSVGEAYRVVRLAQYVYRRASDVLHGRSTMLAVNAVVVEDWERMVGDLKVLYRQWCAMMDGSPDIEVEPSAPSLGTAADDPI